MMEVRCTHIYFADVTSEEGGAKIYKNQKEKPKIGQTGKTNLKLNRELK